MKVLRAGLIFMAVSMSLVACGVGQEELEATHEEAAAGVLSSETQGLLKEPADGSEEPSQQLMCEPGPSSNWCVNVEGKACSTTWRRCYLPNYCEWLICNCVGGAWDCEMP